MGHSFSIKETFDKPRIQEKKVNAVSKPEIPNNRPMLKSSTGAVPEIKPFKYETELEESPKEDN